MANRISSDKKPYTCNLLRKNEDTGAEKPKRHVGAGHEEGCIEVEPAKNARRGSGAVRGWRQRGQQEHVHVYKKKQ